MRCKANYRKRLKNSEKITPKSGRLLPVSATNAITPERSTSARAASSKSPWQSARDSKAERIRQFAGALAAGVAPEEIKHVAILGITTLGFPEAMRALTWMGDCLGSNDSET